MLKRNIPTICTLLLVTAMVFFSEILNNKEIIFPEIAALSVGYMVAEKRSWMVNGRRMLTLITICAVFGVLIVRYMGLDSYSEIVIAFSFAQILFMFSGTTFAPFVSAIVLPVMLQTTSFIYPIAAFLLTLAVILFHKAFLKFGLRQDEPYIPVTLNSTDDVIDTLIRIICVCLLGYGAFFVDMKYIIAPPLLVAFTEFSRPRNKTRNKPLKTVLILTCCAFIGSFSRFIITVNYQFPLTLSAFIATIFLLFIIRKSKMYMPPAGAITILSMLIPMEALISFPIQIFIGSSIIMFLSRTLFMRRQNRQEFDNDHELKAE